MNRVIILHNFIPINILRITPKTHNSLNKLFCTSSLKKAEDKKESAKDEIIRAEDILADLQEPELTEEKIMEKRFKSRLPEKVHKMFVLKEPVPIEYKYDLYDYRLRQSWARFGSKSKLNPGMCWPTRETILETIEYDKIFEPPLQERIRNVEEKRIAELKKRQEYEAEVEKNMANLDKWIADFEGKKLKKKEKACQLKLEREKLVEEISEYLGYDIDPKDPRFKEAVEQKNKEKKKALKAKKQQESYDKMLEKLQKIAQQNKS